VLGREALRSVYERGELPPEAAVQAHRTKHARVERAAGGGWSVRALGSNPVTLQARRGRAAGGAARRRGGRGGGRERALLECNRSPIASQRRRATARRWRGRRRSRRTARRRSRRRSRTAPPGVRERAAGFGWKEGIASFRLQNMGGRERLSALIGVCSTNFYKGLQHMIDQGESVAVIVVCLQCVQGKLVHYSSASKIGAHQHSKTVPGATSTRCRICATKGACDYCVPDMAHPSECSLRCPH